METLLKIVSFHFQDFILLYHKPSKLPPETSDLNTTMKLWQLHTLIMLEIFVERIFCKQPGSRNMDPN